MCICVSTDLTAVMCVVGYVSNMSLYRYGISKRAWPSNRPIPVSNSEIPPLFNLGVLHCVLISWNLSFLQLNCCLKDKPLSVSSTCIFHVPKWIHCFFVIAAHLVRTHFLKISISPLHSLQLNMSLEPSSQGIWVKCIHTKWIHMYYHSALNCLQVILYSWNAAWSIGLLQSCGQGLSLALVGIIMLWRPNGVLFVKDLSLQPEGEVPSLHQLKSFIIIIETVLGVTGKPCELQTLIEESMSFVKPWIRKLKPHFMSKPMHIHVTYVNIKANHIGTMMPLCIALCTREDYVLWTKVQPESRP